MARQAAPLTADSKQFGTPWATFSATPTSPYRLIEVDIGTLQAAPETGELVYWLRLSQFPRDKEEPAEIQWADTRSCGAAHLVIQSLRDVEPPRLITPGELKDKPILIGGSTYTLRMPAQYDDASVRFEMRTNGPRSPLAKVINASLNALETCWSGTVPQREG